MKRVIRMETATDYSFISWLFPSRHKSWNVSQKLERRFHSACKLPTICMHGKQCKLGASPSAVRIQLTDRRPACKLRLTLAQEVRSTFPGTYTAKVRQFRDGALNWPLRTGQPGTTADRKSGWCNKRVSDLESCHCAGGVGDLQGLLTSNITVHVVCILQHP